MTKSDILIGRKNQYIRCRNKAQEVANYLSQAMNKTNEIIEKQNQAYLIDEESPVKNQLADLYQRQKNIYDNIINNIIPNTNIIINNLNTQITDAKQEEAMQMLNE